MFPVTAAAAVSLSEGCRSLPVDTFIAKDTDAVWKDRQSWVWRSRPVYANAYMRLFRCGSARGDLVSLVAE
jgi:hypothetical protein